MAESNTKPVCRQLSTKVRSGIDSNSEEEEIPQFSKGIGKQIKKMEQMLKKCVKTELVGEKKGTKPISGDGEEDEFDYDKWVKEQCEKIKEIEEEDLDKKTMQAIVEESDLSLVSLAQPAIELRRFKCEVSAKLSQVPLRNKKTKRCDKKSLSHFFFSWRTRKQQNIILLIAKCQSNGKSEVKEREIMELNWKNCQFSHQTKICHTLKQDSGALYVV